MFGGAEEDRTPDPLRARQVLSQLSYDPNFWLRLFPLLFVVFARSFGCVLMYAPSFACFDASIKEKILAKIFLFFVINLFFASLKTINDKNRTYSRSFF